MASARELNVAVIGVRNQAARHIELIKSNPLSRLLCVYYPKPLKIKNLPATHRFTDVLMADAIVIASPTHTHAHYLKKLSAYRGYILLEKPAVSTRAESKALLAWPARRKSRVMINFNLHHSQLFEQLVKIIHDRRFGHPISLEVQTSHGLAFDARYRANWRADKKHTLGVLETVGIHYVNLAQSLFGPLTLVGSHVSNQARKTGPVDTGSMFYKSKRNVTVSLHHSYSAPALNRWLLLGTNGFWEYDGATVRFYSPRETRDSAGRFKTPPLVSSRKIIHREMWQKSLGQSLQYFLSTVRRKGKFNIGEFDRGIESMLLVTQAFK